MEINNTVKVSLSFPRSPLRISPAKPGRREFSPFCHSRENGNPENIDQDHWIPDSAGGGSGMTSIRKARQVLWNACILFLLFGLTSFALDNSERVFIWNEANAVMQNAKTPPEYLRAASVYQRLIDDGVRNGPLFYNIGTALLLADRNEQAFNAFERAERYLGRQADNGQNLKIALAKKMKSRTAILPWYRVAAFWHFYLSCPQRTSVASGAFLVFWLALVLRRLGIKRATNALALISLFVFVVFASSVAASWQMESSAGRYQLNFQPPLPPTNAPPVLK